MALDAIQYNLDHFFPFPPGTLVTRECGGDEACGPKVAAFYAGIDHSTIRRETVEYARTHLQDAIWMKVASTTSEGVTREDAVHTYLENMSMETTFWDEVMLQAVAMKYNWKLIVVTSVRGQPPHEVHAPEAPAKTVRFANVVDFHFQAIVERENVPTMRFHNSMETNGPSERLIKVKVLTETTHLNDVVRTYGYASPGALANENPHLRKLIYTTAFEDCEFPAGTVLRSTKADKRGFETVKIVGYDVHALTRVEHQDSFRHAIELYVQHIWKYRREVPTLLFEHEEMSTTQREFQTTEHAPFAMDGKPVGITVREATLSTPIDIDQTFKNTSKDFRLLVRVGKEEKLRFDMFSVYTAKEMEGKVKPNKQFMTYEKTTSQSKKTLPMEGSLETTLKRIQNRPSATQDADKCHFPCDPVTTFALYQHADTMTMISKYIPTKEEYTAEPLYPFPALEPGAYVRSQEMAHDTVHLYYTETGDPLGAWLSKETSSGETWGLVWSYQMLTEVRIWTASGKRIQTPAPMSVPTTIAEWNSVLPTPMTRSSRKHETKTQKKTKKKQKRKATAGLTEEQAAAKRAKKAQSRSPSEVVPALPEPAQALPDNGAHTSSSDTEDFGIGVAAHQSDSPIHMDDLLQSIDEKEMSALEAMVMMDST